MTEKKVFTNESLSTFVKEIKAYTDSQRLGYAEPNTFTFDGNPDGKVKDGDTVKISGESPSASTFVKACGNFYGQVLEVGMEDCTLNILSSMAEILYNGIVIARIVYDTSYMNEVGVYVACDPATESYVSYIEFAETIHKIDTKFIPDSIARVDDIIQPVNPDLNQNDPTAPDYVKNRLAYPIDKVIVDDTILYGSGVENAVILYDTPIVEGETYHILHDGKVYKAYAQQFEYKGVISLILIDADTDKMYTLPINVEYLIADADGRVDDVDVGATRIQAQSDVYLYGKPFSIVIPNADVKKIDQKFLYKPDWNQNDESAPDYIKNRIGYVDPSFTLTFDGDTTNKFVYDRGDGTFFVQISTNVIDLHEKSIISATVSVAGTNQRYEASSLSINEKPEWFEIYANGILGAVYIPEYLTGFELPQGLHVIHDPNGTIMGAPVWVSEIEFSETVHKIDPKYLPEGGFGYEESYEGKITYTFDGDINNALESVLVMQEEDISYYYVKLSNNTPSMESIIGGSCSLYEEGQITTSEITEDMIMDGTTEGIPGHIVNNAFLMLNENANLGGILLSAGIWVMCIYHNTMGGIAYGSEFSYDGTGTKVYKIDGKFLHQPDWNQNDPSKPDFIKNRLAFDDAYEVTWDGQPTEVCVQPVEGLCLCLVSKSTPTINELIGGTIEGVMPDGEIGQMIIGLDIPIEEVYGAIAIGEIGIIIVPDVSKLFSEFEGLFPENGIYFMNDNGAYISKLTWGILKQIDEKFIPDTIARVKDISSDWNQNNESATDYIKNRTHYEERDESLILPETTFTFSSSGSVVSNPRWLGYAKNKVYTIIWDGVKYECPAFSMYPRIGNESIKDANAVDTGEPFLMTYGAADVNGYIYSRESGDHTVEIYCVDSTFHQLDKRYIPNPISSEVIASEWLRDEYNLSYGQNIDVAFEKIKDNINSKIGQDYIILKDTVNGFNYVLQMRNGNLVTMPKINYIKVTTQPTKIDYLQGEIFDPSGMVVTAYCEDGTSMPITDYSCPKYVMSDVIKIECHKFGMYLYAYVYINFTQFDPEVYLEDFNYVENKDGTFTITGWKETRDGVSSGDMIIPNNHMIKL